MLHKSALIHLLPENLGWIDGYLVDVAHHVVPDQTKSNDGDGYDADGDDGDDDDDDDYDDDDDDGGDDVDEEKTGGRMLWIYPTGGFNIKLKFRWWWKLPYGLFSLLLSLRIV